MKAPTERRTIAQAAAAKDTPEKPYEVRSAKVPGLLLRVQPSGKRTYYVQIARGKRVRVGPASQLTLKQAEERAKPIILDPSSADKPKRDRATLAEYIEDEYKDFAEANLKNGKRSVARVKAVWKPLLNKRMTDVTASDVDKLRTKRRLAGIAPATINRDVAALSGLFSHWTAHHKGVHPLAGLEQLGVADDETVRYLTPEESTRLRKALADRDAEGAKQRASANEWRKARGYELLPEVTGNCDHMTPMVLLSLNTGIRQGELFSLAWENVDLERRTITILASHSKGNATRVIPLNAEAHAVLVAIKPKDAARGLVFKSPITGGRFDNVKKAWAEITKAAGVPDLRWHDLRHDFASQLVMRGVPLFTVQKLLGHKNARMTQRYAKLAPSALADAVSLLGATE